MLKTDKATAYLVFFVLLEIYLQGSLDVAMCLNLSTLFPRRFFEKIEVVNFRD